MSKKKIKIMFRQFKNLKTIKIKNNPNIYFKNNNKKKVLPKHGLSSLFPQTRNTKGVTVAERVKLSETIKMYVRSTGRLKIKQVMMNCIQLVKKWQLNN